MAQSTVIREFLVALGFKVDEKGLKKFTDGVDQATKGVKQLVTTISASALAVSVGVSALASKLENLYFVSKRTGAAASSLKAFDFAARNLGISTETAFGAVESLAKFLRNNPAGEGYLASIGVQTRNANGELRDTVDILADLGKELGKRPTWLASQYGNVLGIDENLLLAMRDGDFAKFMQQYREMSRRNGLDKAAEDAHAFMVALRGLGTTFENFGIKVEGALLRKMGPMLDRFSDWFEKHGDEIADRIADIASAIVDAVAAATPAIKWIADKFVELDKDTDGLSTKILLLIGAFKVLGGASVVGGISSLATAVAAVGAAFAGWKIGDSVRDFVDKFITEKSGGKYRSIWDIITNTDRSGLDATGGFTQKEIDSVKNNGGARLTPEALARLNGAVQAVAGGDKRLPRGIRNNNPGNLNYAGQDGATKEAGPNGRFAVFGTAEQGLEALAVQIKRYANAGMDSIRAIIEKYAPKGENNTDAYIANLTKRFGVADTTKLDFSNKETMANMMAAITQIENGQNPYTRDAMVAAAAKGVQHTGKFGGGNVGMSQKTTINLYGVSDPAAAGRAIADEQRQVNDDMVRNMQGAFS